MGILYDFVFTEEEAERKREEDAKSKQAESVGEFPHRRKNMMVSGMVALTAMVGYAFLSGLVSIDVSDKDNGNKIEEGDSEKSQRASAPNFNQFDRLFDENNTTGSEQGSGEDQGQKDENAN